MDTVNNEAVTKETSETISNTDSAILRAGDFTNFEIAHGWGKGLPS